MRKRGIGTESWYRVSTRSAPPSTIRISARDRAYRPSVIMGDARRSGRSTEAESSLLMARLPNEFLPPERAVQERPRRRAPSRVVQRALDLRPIEQIGIVAELLQLARHLDA